MSSNVVCFLLPGGHDLNAGLWSGVSGLGVHVWLIPSWWWVDSAGVGPLSCSTLVVVCAAQLEGLRLSG
jgi:hypothetical protein